MSESSWSERERRIESSGGRQPKAVDRLERGLAEHIAFLQSFLREPGKVGALNPSSPVLARAMVSSCPLESAATVIELGPGTGAFTGMIRERIRPQATFIALELDPEHVRGLRRKFPGLHVYHDSAERLIDYLTLHRKKHADCIVSGLPWAILPPALQARLMDSIQEALAPRGVFATFGYAHARWLPKARRFREDLGARFPKVETSSVVWRNIPPAFVYRCSK